MNDKWPDTFKIRNKAHPKNLELAMQVVAFEVTQMIDAFLAMQKVAATAIATATETGYTAYLESALLHVRNLMEFMIDKSVSATKITYRDFVSKDDFHVDGLANFGPIRELISQHLVHMDWKRTLSDSTLVTIPVEELVASTIVALGETFRSFVNLLPAGSKERQFFEASTQASLGNLDAWNHITLENP